jgi:hypothetical protein
MRPRSDCKLLPADASVQLIVFFVAIRETLKREIYGGDKERFCPMKTKAWFGLSHGVYSESRIQLIWFANADD